MNNPTSNNLKSNPPVMVKTAEFADLTVEQIKKEILSHNYNCRQVARTTLMEAWSAGRYLNALKGRLKHGEYTPWLKSAGIAESTALQYRRLADRYKQSQLGEFNIIDDAIKSLPGPDPASSARPARKPSTYDNDTDETNKETPPAGKADAPPQVKLTPAERRLIEQEELKGSVTASKEVISDLETQLAEKDKVLQHYETSGKVSEGFIQGRDVIEAGNEHIRQLKYSLNNCGEEKASLKRENFGLKKALKEKDAELEKLRSERDNAVDRYDEFVSKLRADFQSTDDQDYDIPGHAG